MSDKLGNLDSLLEGIVPSRRNFLRSLLVAGAGVALFAPPSSSLADEDAPPPGEGKGKGKGKGDGKGKGKGKGKGDCKGKGKGDGKGKGKGKGDDSGF